MNNIFTRRLTTNTVIALMLGSLYTPYSIADIVGDSQWRVERGDSVYSIARKMFPDNSAKQKQFRGALIKDNPEVFRNGANLMRVGTVLQLPGFAIAKPAPKSTETAEPKAVAATSETIANKPMEKQQTVTPDPADIIGKVVISAGKMQADNRGTVRVLRRNSIIYKGDTLKTARAAYTQVRMKDGALISLRPNTTLRITDYNFNGKQDGSERSFFELVAGGFRTITGLIGHKNKANYRVRTSVATIGIRGTHYGLMLCENNSCQQEDASLKDGLYGGVVDGSVAINNESGETVFDNDQYFHVESAFTPPVEQLSPPPVFHGKAEQKLASINEKTQEKATAQLTKLKEKIDQNADAEQSRDSVNNRIKNFISEKGDASSFTPPPSTISEIVLPVLRDQQDNAINNNDNAVNLAPNGAGVLVSLQSTDDVTGEIDNIAAAVFSGINNFNEIVLGNKQTAAGNIGNLPIAIQEFSDNKLHQLALPSGTVNIDNIGGNAMGVNWGRWAQASHVLTEDNVPRETFGNVHYIYSDNLTSPTQLAALGGLSVSETYTLAGGTIPTNALGNNATLHSIDVTMDFQSNMMTQYDIHASNGNANFMMNAGGPVSFNNMKEFDLVNYSCNVSCQGRASAAFVGAQAQGLITTYSISEMGGPKGANGAAFLTRDSMAIPANQ